MKNTFCQLWNNLICEKNWKAIRMLNEWCPQQGVRFNGYFMQKNDLWCKIGKWRKGIEHVSNDAAEPSYGFATEAKWFGIS